MGAAGSKRRNSKPATLSDTAFAGSLVRVPAHDPRWADRELAPLHAAAKTNDVAALRKLLLAPPHVDERDRGESALHLAAEEGHTEAAALLLDAGADVNSTNNDGWSPLHAAAQGASTDMLSLVLARGANLGARTAIQATPLHMAAFNGRLGAVKLLVLLGADAAAVDKDGHTPADDARYRLQDCPCKTDEPERQWGAVIAFLEKAAPMAADERRDFAQRSWGLDVAQTLGEAAARGDATELARLLACYPREDDVNARDHDGAAALHAAAEAGHAAAVDLLVDKRADVALRTHYDDTALHLAARQGHLAAARLLVARGADVRATNRFGRTALGDAADSPEVAAFLEAAGAADGPKGPQFFAIKALMAAT